MVDQHGTEPPVRRSETQRGKRETDPEDMQGFGYPSTLIPAKAAADPARDEEVAAEWAFHDYILGVKTQVKAQFRDSSNELQALGLKKKSEYKSPSKKQPTP